MKIAILHQNADEADRLSALVVAAGWQPTSFSCGVTLERALEQISFDLLLMRWDGQRLSGSALAYRLRKRMAPPPAMIMLIDPAAPGGIGELADAALPDPCSETDLEACLDATARRFGIGEEGRAIAGVIFFNEATSTVEVNGLPVELTRKEFALAQFMMQHLGAELSRDKIMMSVWGRPDNPGSRTLDAHMAQLRKRLFLRPENGWRLSSVYGQGYRLEKLDNPISKRTAPPLLMPSRSRLHTRAAHRDVYSQVA